MTNFFDVFWAGTPNQKIDPSPQPETAATAPLTTMRLRLPEPTTPRDAGLTDPVRLVRKVEERMRQEGLLDDDEPSRRRSRLQRPANDRKVTPRRCA